MLVIYFKNRLLEAYMRRAAGRGTCAAGRRPSPFHSPSNLPLPAPPSPLLPTRPELACPHAMQEPYHCTTTAHKNHLSRSTY